MPGMGRPGLPVGTWGDVSATQLAPSKWKARARYRDRDGVVRMVARFGQSKTDATNRLRQALADRQHDAGVGIMGSTTIRALSADWLAEVEASRKAVKTKEAYRTAVERYVVPEMAALRVSEAGTPVVDAALKRITVARGPGAAKMARSVLNGMFGLAVRHGALTVNPVRETGVIPRGKKLSRSLTLDQVTDLSDRLASDERAVYLDVADLVEFGLATGCRIGEATAIRGTVLDLEAGTVEINATTVRVPGRGMVVQERPKTAAGWRRLALPDYAVEMLRRRQGEIRFNPPAITLLDVDGQYRTVEGEWLVFASPSARAVRDPSNTAADLREVLDSLGYDWVSFHTFRRTVATLLDAGGMTSREIADQLGHAQPSMTLDRYMGRKVVSARSAEVLDR